MIQFEPDERQAGDQMVRDFKVRAFGTQEVVRVTVWPEYADVPLRKGDFVVVQGKRRRWTSTDHDGVRRELSGIDARLLVKVSAQPRRTG